MGSVEMSTAVVETTGRKSPNFAGNSMENVDKIEENVSKLEELTEKMDSVKIDEETSSDPEKIIKHPLQNAWTLWFFKNDKSRSWEENQRPIITVTTVEDFWSLYNHIEVASRLPPGSDYSLFKEGIFPDWEDPSTQMASFIDFSLKNYQILVCNNRKLRDAATYVFGGASRKSRLIHHGAGLTILIHTGLKFSSS